jgi:hypothetical protein
MLLLNRSCFWPPLKWVLKRVLHQVADYLQVVNGGTGSWGVHLDGGVAILKLLAAKRPLRVPAARMQLQFVFSGVSSLSDQVPGYIS